MIKLPKSVKTLIGLVILVLVIFVIINWSFFEKNVSYWWQNSVTKTWNIPTGDLAEANQLRIASLDIEAPLIYIDQTGEDVFQEALAQGVVHYPGTAMPGEYGNAFYFGHSSDFAYKPGEYKTIFALLPQIQLGEKIEITDQGGRLYEYEVFNTLVVSPTQLEVLDQGDRQEKLLTLQTSYPVGTALGRFIVQAKLI